ncbi:MAG: V-type ATPase subunit [Verrucomicrobiota bacterium]
MAGPLSKYALINAKLRGRISKILPEEGFAQLSKAPSLDTVLALLRDTAYSGLEGIYAQTGDLKLAELELLKLEIRLYIEIGQHVHKNTQPILKALLTRFEIDNLKNAIRVYFDRRVRGRSVEASVHYILHEKIIHPIPMEVVASANGFDEIAGVCQNTPYGEIIRKYSHAVESEGSLFRLEVALDHYYYETLLASVEHLSVRDKRIARRLIGTEIDLQNINWIMRLKRYYDLPLETVLATLVPGGYSLRGFQAEDLYRTQDMASLLQGFVKEQYPGLSTLLGTRTSDSAARLRVLQQILEEVKRQEVQRILSGYPFTIGIILAYFFLKGDEMLRVRTLLNAKQYGKAPVLAGAT